MPPFEQRIFSEDNGEEMEQECPVRVSEACEGALDSLHHAAAACAPAMQGRTPLVGAALTGLLALCWLLHVVRLLMWPVGAITAFVMVLAPCFAVRLALGLTPPPPPPPPPPPARAPAEVPRHDACTQEPDEAPAEASRPLADSYLLLGLRDVPYPFPFAKPFAQPFVPSLLPLAKPKPQSVCDLFPRHASSATIRDTTVSITDTAAEYDNKIITTHFPPKPKNVTSPTSLFHSSSATSITLSNFCIRVPSSFPIGSSSSSEINFPSESITFGTDVQASSTLSPSDTSLWNDVLKSTPTNSKEAAFKSKESRTILGFFTSRAKFGLSSQAAASRKKQPSRRSSSADSTTDESVCFCGVLKIPSEDSSSSDTATPSPNGSFPDFATPSSLPPPPLSFADSLSLCKCNLAARELSRGKVFTLFDLYMELRRRTREWDFDKPTRPYDPLFKCRMCANGLPSVTRNA